MELIEVSAAHGRDSDLLNHVAQVRGHVAQVRGHPHEHVLANSIVCQMRSGSETIVSLDGS